MNKKTTRKYLTNARLYGILTCVKEEALASHLATHFLSCYQGFYGEVLINSDPYAGGANLHFYFL